MNKFLGAAKVRQLLAELVVLTAVFNQGSITLILSLVQRHMNVKMSAASLQILFAGMEELSEVKNVTIKTLDLEMDADFAGLNVDLNVQLLDRVA